MEAWGRHLPAVLDRLDVLDRSLGIRSLAGDLEKLDGNIPGTMAGLKHNPETHCLPMAALRADAVGVGQAASLPILEGTICPAIWVRTALPCFGLRAKPDLLGSPKQVVAAQNGWQEDPLFLGQHPQLKESVFFVRIWTPLDLGRIHSGLVESWL